LVFVAQSASLAHARHESRSEPLLLQTGVGLAHSESFTHCTHVRVAVSHAWLEQSLLARHPTQTPVCTSQTWFVLALQSGLDVHWTHWPAVVPIVAHAGVGATQSAAVHARHAPPGSHTGVAPVQSVPVQARHTWLASSQIGVGREHCVSVVHWGVGDAGPAVSQSMRALSKSPCT
jgi:hypothetical protein